MDDLTPEAIAAAEWAEWEKSYTWHLDQVPVLLETIRELAIPLKAAVYDNVRVSGGGEHAPLPFRVEAIDQADDLWAALVQYAANVNDVLGAPWKPAPALIRQQWRTQNDVAGLRATASLTTVRGQAFQIIAWLIDVIDGTGTHPELADGEEHLFRLIRSGRARYVSAPTSNRTRPRTCTTCLERKVVVTWVNAENGRASKVARCEACGETWTEQAETAA